MAKQPPAYVPQKYAESDDSDPGDEQGPNAGREDSLTLRNPHHHLSPVGELLSSSEDEESLSSIDGYDCASQHASDPVEVASTSEDIDVWENLQQIFADMDAQDGNDENKLLLREPLARLRRLLHIHTDVLEREKALRKCHLGVLVERDWYLGKLRDIEGTVESVSLEESTEAADVAFSGAVRSILYEERPPFRLAGSKSRG